MLLRVQPTDLLIAPTVSDSYFGFLRKDPLGSAVRMGRRKSHPGCDNAPGVSITSSQAASAVSVVGHCLPGLSGNI